MKLAAFATKPTAGVATGLSVAAGEAVVVGLGDGVGVALGSGVGAGDGRVDGGVGVGVGTGVGLADARVGVGALKSSITIEAVTSAVRLLWFSATTANSVAPALDGAPAISLRPPPKSFSSRPAGAAGSRESCRPLPPGSSNLGRAA